MRAVKWIICVWLLLAALGAHLDPSAPNNTTTESTSRQPIGNEPVLLPLPEGKDALLDDVAQPVRFTPPKSNNAPNADTSPPDQGTTVYVTGSSVNVRKTAEIANNVVGQFTKGTQITRFETKNNWTRVRGMRAGKPLSGWMSTTYLSAQNPQPKRAAQKAPTRTVAIPSNREITRARKAIIQQSINGYSGSCPCPFNTDRGGRRCGKRSAWSRPGGYAPICYESDVSRSRLVSYFARLGKQFQ